MIRVRVLKREQVEEEAASLLQTYVQGYGGSAEPPIDVDMIGEAMLHLTWDWDEIDEPPRLQTQPGAPSGRRPGSLILAGLYPRQRRVVMNELHADVFKAKPGLERFTKGHEIGHWVMHVDQAVLDLPSLFDLDGDDALPDDTIICRDGDDTWTERQANWFSAELLMPRDPFLAASRAADMSNWRARYDLAELFGVTISALGYRLNRFGMSYVDEDGAIHRSASEAHGQIALG